MDQSVRVLLKRMVQLLVVDPAFAMQPPCFAEVEEPGGHRSLHEQARAKAQGVGLLALQPGTHVDKQTLGLLKWSSCLGLG